jgi:hypothetical protein
MHLKAITGVIPAHHSPSLFRGEQPPLTSVGVWGTVISCVSTTLPAAAVNVNVANIPMPTEEERAEMRALDRKLDAFAAMLKR